MKLKLTLAAALLAVLASVGCSSSSNSGGSSSGIFCSVVSAGTQVACAGSRDMPATDQQTYKDQCTKNGGTIVNACPTDSLLGCCTRKGANGYNVESCVYGASSDAGSTGDAGTMADMQKQQCSSTGGTWSTTS